MPYSRGLDHPGPNKFDKDKMANILEVAASKGIYMPDPEDEVPAFDKPAQGYIEIRAMGETTGRRYPIEGGQVIIQQFTQEQMDLYFGQAPKAEDPEDSEEVAPPVPAGPEWLEQAEWLVADAIESNECDGMDSLGMAVHLLKLALPAIREGLAEEIEAQGGNQWTDELAGWLNDDWDNGYGVGITTAVRTVLPKQ